MYMTLTFVAGSDYQMSSLNPQTPFCMRQVSFPPVNPCHDLMPPIISGNSNPNQQSASSHAIRSRGSHEGQRLLEGKYSHSKTLHKHQRASLVCKPGMQACKRKITEALESGCSKALIKNRNTNLHKVSVFSWCCCCGSYSSWMPQEVYVWDGEKGLLTLQKHRNTVRSCC